MLLDSLLLVQVARVLCFRMCMGQTTNQTTASCQQNIWPLHLCSAKDFFLILICIVPQSITQ